LIPVRFVGTAPVAVALFCAALAAPARAQTPMLTTDDFRSSADIAVAVSLQGPADVNQQPACQQLAVPCLTPRTFGDLGIALSATLYATNTVGIVGEAGVYGNHWSAYDPGCDRAHSVCAASETNTVRAVLGGLKWRTPLITAGSTRGRVFGQVTVGPQWSDVGPRRRALQPGAGYDGYFGNGMMVRVQFDYRFVPRDARDLSTGRVSLGLAVPLGSSR
jgi:hypothetical protein